MKRTRLRPVSAKRLAERGQRAEVVAAALARDGGCVLRCGSRQRIELLYHLDLLEVTKHEIPPRDCWLDTDAHEIQGRGVRPGGHLDVDNVVTLCRGHHDWCHAHVPESRAMGLKVSAS